MSWKVGVLWLSRKENEASLGNDYAVFAICCPRSVFPSCQNSELSRCHSKYDGDAREDSWDLFEILRLVHPGFISEYQRSHCPIHKAKPLLVHALCHFQFCHPEWNLTQWQPELPIPFLPIIEDIDTFYWPPFFPQKHNTQDGRQTVRESPHGIWHVKAKLKEHLIHNEVQGLYSAKRTTVNVTTSTVNSICPSHDLGCSCQFLRTPLSQQFTLSEEVLIKCSRNGVCH